MPPKTCVSSVMDILTGRSAMMIFD
ncbi:MULTISPECIES: hypothetical protein [Enterococcus]